MKTQPAREQHPLYGIFGEERPGLSAASGAQNRTEKDKVE
jgi:hypothetical protein